MYNLNTFPLSMQFARSFSGQESMVRTCTFFFFLLPDNLPFYLTLDSIAISHVNVLVTECLEYPDFSCVVLYGHVIVGFAFMVPDVSYNEAYITYLFTHPEWRNAGIAKFMLYHLIQVSTNNLTTL